MQTKGELMTSSFLSAFPGYWRRPAGDYNRAIKESLIVLDSNILLGLYRFTPKARNELFEALSKTQNRLWVPNQVAKEFYDRRIDAVKEHIDLYESVPKTLMDLKSKIETALRTFANRCSLPDDDKEQLLIPIEAAISDITKKIKKHESAFDLTLEKVVNSDPILSSLARLLDGKTGEPFGPDEELTLIEEYKKRAESEIPPGYRDAGKKQNAHGDFFIWEQVLRESISRKMPVLLVTNDTKEDWVRKEAGLVVGARPELIIEMKERAGTDFLITQLGLFLNYARQELGAAISSSTVAQAEGLEPRSPITSYMQVSREEYEDLVEYFRSYIAASYEETESLEKMAGDLHEPDRSNVKQLILGEARDRNVAISVLDALRQSVISEGHEGLIFAVPDNSASAMIRQYLARGHKKRRVIGERGRSGPQPTPTHIGIDFLLQSQRRAQAERDRFAQVIEDARSRAREGDQKAFDEFAEAIASVRSADMHLRMLEDSIRRLNGNLDSGEGS
jgi:hypothetical protein